MSSTAARFTPSNTLVAQHTLEQFLNWVTPGYALILRGCPGSGKSTLVEEMRKKTFGVAVASADAHRMKQGIYVYDPKKNDEAHAGSLRDFVEAAQLRFFDGGAESDIIVADNTNTTALECAPYVAVARAYGWSPLIVTLLVPPDVAAPRNLHNVPDHKVEEMYNRLTSAKLPSHWSQITII